MLRVLTYILLIFSGYSCSTNKDFDFAINEMKVIKKMGRNNETYYESIIFTPENYSSTANNRTQTVVASFFYKGQKASIKIVVDYASEKIKFIRIGEESDYFVFAISELFEEEIDQPIMKDIIECSFYDGEVSDKGLLNIVQRYKTGYQPNENDTKGAAPMILSTDLKKGYIELCEKNNGLTKKNFVKAFEK